MTAKARDLVKGELDVVEVPMTRVEAETLLGLLEQDCRLVVGVLAHRIARLLRERSDGRRERREANGETPAPAQP